MPAEVEPGQEADTGMHVESDKRWKGLALLQLTVCSPCHDTVVSDDLGWAGTSRPGPTRESL